MPAGRPTSYSETMLARAKEYIAGGYHEQDDQMPSIVGLRKYLGVARSTIYEWAEKNPEFSDTLDELEDEQERTLFNKGLDGTFNSTITKLALGNHGYSDKTDNTVRGPNGGGLIVNFLGVGNGPA